MKITLAKDTDHEFEVELPFKTNRELSCARVKFKKEVLDRKDNGPCWEFYLQFLDNSYTVDDIKPNKDRGLCFLIKKYGKIEGEKRYKQRLEKDKIKNTLEGFIERYGDIGKEKYFDKNKKLSVSEESLKLNGFSDSEIIEIRNRHAEKSARTLQNYVDVHGLQEGKIQYENYIKNIRSQWQTSYWISEGFSEDESKKIISKLQSRDLNFFINKYGDEEGRKKYSLFNKKRVSATRGTNVSKLEVKLYNEVYKLYNDVISTYTIDNYVVDIFIPSEKIIIEVFGDYWHCNPLFWEAKEYNKTLHMKAEEKWIKDKNRINYLKNSGFKVIVIWEKELYDKNFNIKVKINESK